MLKNVIIEKVEQRDRPELMNFIEFLCLGKKYSRGKDIFIKLRYVIQTSNYYNYRSSGYFYGGYSTTASYEKNHLYSNYRRPTTNELYWLVLNIMSREEVF